MPFGDNNAQAKCFKQMMTFCLRYHVVNKSGLYHCSDFSMPSLDGMCRHTVAVSYAIALRA